MKLRIKKNELVKDQYWHYIKVTMVWLYDDDGKWVKWIKLDELALKAVKGDIEIGNEYDQPRHTKDREKDPEKIRDDYLAK